MVRYLDKVLDLDVRIIGYIVKIANACCTINSFRSSVLLVHPHANNRGKKSYKFMRLS